MSRTDGVAWMALLSLAGCAGSWSDFPGIPCADVLCGWHIDEGQVAPARSWSEHEPALALNAVPTQLSVVVGSTSSSCLMLALMANVAADAELVFTVDFNDDGHVEHSMNVPATSWGYIKLPFVAPADYRSARCVLRKNGPGAAVVSYVGVTSGSGCIDTPITLQDGALCVHNETCSSGRCRNGVCQSCGVGGCLEGESCNADQECAHGTCAAGQCRECARNGSCAPLAACSSGGQCSAGACVQGLTPSLASSVAAEAVCAECTNDAQCNGGFCQLGTCGSCRSDADCTDGMRCRYRDLYDQRERTCAPGPSAPLPRAALCEADADCGEGLGCAAGAGLAKRCGVACSANEQCGVNQVCARPGATQKFFFLDTDSDVQLPQWQEVSSRVRTCYARVEFGPSGEFSVNGAAPLPCLVREQCPSSLICCNGFCEPRAGGIFDFCAPPSP